MTNAVIARSAATKQSRWLAPRRLRSVGAAGLIEAVAQLLAGLEEGDVLFGDLHAVAGARVAPDSGIAALDRKGAKAAQFDPIAAGQRCADLVEDGGNDRLDIALVEMRVRLCEALNELRLGHAAMPAGKWKTRLPCQTVKRASSNRPLPSTAERDGEARHQRASLPRRPASAFLFVDLARLDRHRHAPRRAVDRGDLGVDPLADRKAVGALLAAVARQLGFPDEAGHTVGHRDLDPGFGDRCDRAGDDIAFLHLGDARLERIGLELLAAERDALLLDIDIEHLDTHDLPLVVVAH